MKKRSELKKVKFIFLVIVMFIVVLAISGCLEECTDECKKNIPSGYKLEKSFIGESSDEVDYCCGDGNKDSCHKIKGSREGKTCNCVYIKDCGDAGCNPSTGKCLDYGDKDYATPNLDSCSDYCTHYGYDSFVCKDSYSSLGYVLEESYYDSASTCKYAAYKGYNRCNECMGYLYCIRSTEKDDGCDSYGYPYFTHSQRNDDYSTITSAQLLDLLCPAKRKIGEKFFVHYLFKSKEDREWKEYPSSGYDVPGYYKFTEFLETRIVERKDNNWVIQSTKNNNVDEQTWYSEKATVSCPSTPGLYTYRVSLKLTPSGGDPKPLTCEVECVTEDVQRKPKFVFQTNPTSIRWLWDEFPETEKYEIMDGEKMIKSFPSGNLPKRIGE